MENTPTVCADDLPTILGNFKNDVKSRSVNIFSSGWILPQTVEKKILTSQSSAKYGSRPLIPVSFYIQARVGGKLYQAGTPESERTLNVSQEVPPDCPSGVIGCPQERFLG